MASVHISRPVSLIVCRSLAAAATLLAITGVVAAEEASPLPESSNLSSGDFNMPGTGRPAAMDPTRPQPVPPVAKTGRGEWVVAPIPNYSPAQQWALGLVAMYIFKPEGADPSEPPSVIGGGGFITQEESYGGVLGYSGHLDSDRWRVTAGGGYALLNYDFFGIGNAAALADHPIRIEQHMTGGLLQVLGRIAPDLYLGPRLYTLNIDATGRLSSSSAASLPPLEAKSTTVALGGKLQWDTRDNTFYPTSGNLLNATIDIFGQAFGSDFNYQTYELEYNHYMPLTEKDVLALRGYGRTVNGDVPFYDLGMFGQHNDLRGYESGKYRDKLMLATQGEMRHMLNDWLGIAAFAGVGEVAPDVGSLTFDNLLWSVGGGLRFRIARENPINFRIDYAQGKDGGTAYISIGEAF